ncbi:hypothetical protein AGMMS50239_05310 [Bacteroidia bacterium]|nr:hypothetical protein AGMMS50239_05310 [Bacteroidia bacterium]
MREQEIIYESLLNRFRNTLPAPRDPEILTQSIRSKIERITDGTYRQKRRKMRMFSLVSGIAASLLLCLLLHDMGMYRNIGENKPSVRRETTVFKTNNYLKNNTIDEIIKEKTAILHRKESLSLLIQKRHK